MRRLACLALLMLTAACDARVKDPPPAVAEDPLPAPDLSDFEDAVRETLEKARERIAGYPENGEAWGEYGNLLWKYGLHEEALVCLDVARRRAPNKVRWAILRAYVLSDFDRPAAADAFAEALALQPDHAEGFVQYGKLLRKLDQNDQAREAFERALELREGDFEALLGLGQIALDRCDHAGAIEMLQAAAAVDDRDRRVHEALARAYFAQGDPDRGREHSRRAQELSR